ncbi:MAG: hypothetical protein HY303_16510 [Candidatus Wallbacteria bacterium]|nr:hypothetical protein [Candidatus Wallbacteria bacterium]
MSTYRVLLSTGAYVSVTAPMGVDLVDHIRDARAKGFRFSIAQDIDSGGQILLALDHIAMVHPIVGKATRMHQLLCLLDQARRMREYLNDVACHFDEGVVAELTRQFDEMFARWSTPSPEDVVVKGDRESPR